MKQNDLQGVVLKEEYYQQNRETRLQQAREEFWNILNTNPKYEYMIDQIADLPENKQGVVADFFAVLISDYRQKPTDAMFWSGQFLKGNNPVKEYDLELDEMVAMQKVCWKIRVTSDEARNRFNNSENDEQFIKRTKTFGFKNENEVCRYLDVRMKKFDSWMQYLFETLSTSLKTYTNEMMNENYNYVRMGENNPYYVAGDTALKIFLDSLSQDKKRRLIEKIVD
jgi:hypothetical protein